MLCRPVAASFTLLASGVNQYKVNPWKLLIESPQIASQLQYFRFLRADVKIKILARSSVFQYGAYSATSVYGFTETESITRFNKETRVSGPRAVIGDITDRTAIEYHMPYMSPNTFIDVKNQDSSPHLPGIFLLDMWFSDSINTTTPSSVDFQVYFNFENVTVTGVRTPTEVVAQSGNFQMPGATGTITTASTILGILGYNQYEKQIKGAKDIYNAFTSERKGPVHDSKSVKLTPFGNLSDTSYSSESQLLGSHYNLKSPTNDMIVAGEDISTILDIIKIPGIVTKGVITSVGNLEVGVDPNIGQSDTTNCSYLDYMSRFFRLWRGSIKMTYMFFTAPMITARIRVSVTWDSVHPSEDSIGNVWSKIIAIQGSQNVALDVPFIRPYAWEDTIPDGNDLVPRLILEVLDAPSGAGDSVPAVYYMLFKGAGDDFLYEGLRSSTADNNTTSFTQTTERVRSKGTVTAQCDIQSFYNDDSNFEKVNDFVSDFQFHGSGEISNIGQMISRFSQRPSEAGSVSQQILQYDSNDTYAAISMFDVICNMYRYYSGSLRFKISGTTAGSSVKSIYMKNGMSSVAIDEHKRAIENGGAVIQPLLWNVFEFETRFYCRALAAPCYTAISPFFLPYEIVSDFSTIHAVFVAAGHDFKLYGLLPPPLGSFMPYLKRDNNYDVPLQL